MCWSLEADLGESVKMRWCLEAKVVSEQLGGGRYRAGAGSMWREAGHVRPRWDKYDRTWRLYFLSRLLSAANKERKMEQHDEEQLLGLDDTQVEDSLAGVEDERLDKMHDILIAVLRELVGDDSTGRDSLRLSNAISRADM
ncbi:hypothetical protein GOP47_0026837 [Adiantum capillus-veneris]|nr:hypothetical protein GOP47_0026837 [Adiantum capillus-veneris]